LMSASLAAAFTTRQMALGVIPSPHILSSRLTGRKMVPPLMPAAVVHSTREPERYGCAFPCQPVSASTVDSSQLERNAGVPIAARRHSFEPSFPAITLGQSQDCDLPGKQKGLVDRLRHLTAQTFACDVVGAEMLPGVNPTQSRLLRRR
jgi:hypothetical protein